MSQSRLSRAGLYIALAMCGLMTTQSMAKWPGDVASPGSALDAKAIGQECRILNAQEIAELDAYLAKARAEMARKNPAFDFDDFVARLFPQYVARYHDNPIACTAAAAEEARDTLAKVRTAFKTGKFLGNDS